MLERLQGIYDAEVYEEILFRFCIQILHQCLQIRAEY